LHSCLGWQERQADVTILHFLYHGELAKSQLLNRMGSLRRVDLLARMFHELMSRDRGDGRAIGQLVPRYRRIESEAYLNSTSQGEPVLSEVEGTTEDARLPARRAYSSERRTVILFALAPLSPASGFPVSRSQQPTHETSELGDFNDHEGNIILGFAARSEAIQIVIDGVENVVCF
jgi:hypothetical protein